MPAMSPENRSRPYGKSAGYQFDWANMNPGDFTAPSMKLRRNIPDLARWGIPASQRCHRRQLDVMMRRPKHGPAKGGFSI
jgi:hypothetical protein